tara:strand:- start:292 stop:1422 length:1131 start_codon:yes stop_codon:yes gene_type:complete
MNTNSNPDILIIGGGIAGASAAASLSQAGINVVLVDMESQCGYHTTGRSAATFVSCYGNHVIRSLSAASRAFLSSPPEGFSAFPLLSSRGALFVADETRIKDLEAHITDPYNAGLLDALDATDARKLSPELNPETIAMAAFEPGAADIDVDALLQGYFAQFRNAGGKLVTKAGVTNLFRQGGSWTVDTCAGRFSTPLIINASGAWADEVARLAGCTPIGLVPKRRTALTFDPRIDISSWPLTISVDESWYFRPEGGHLLISPADETPYEPCDVQPDEMDIAICIERIEHSTSMKVDKIISKRAGLRSFVFDKSPVVGFAYDVEGFFWLVGQGGYGIQTAPAIAELCTSLILHGEVPISLSTHGINIENLSPLRLRV